MHWLLVPREPRCEEAIHHEGFGGGQEGGPEGVCHGREPSLLCDLSAKMGRSGSSSTMQQEDGKEGQVPSHLVTHPTTLDAAPLSRVFEV